MLINYYMGVWICWVCLSSAKGTYFNGCLYSWVILGNEKFLDTSGVRRNSVSSSHIHGKPQDEFNK